MPNVFINYRREEGSGYAGRLYSDLKHRLGEGRVFMDLSIEPGEDFADVINDRVSQCEVQLVVIGRNWIKVTDEGGQRRLDNPDDFVRLEIAAALKRKIRVIPVILEGANIPKRGELPEELQPLVSKQTMEISDHRWDHDVSRLAEVIERVFKLTEASRTPAKNPPPPPRVDEPKEKARTTTPIHERPTDVRFPEPPLNESRQKSPFESSYAVHTQVDPSPNGLFLKAYVPLALAACLMFAVKGIALASFSEQYYDRPAIYVIVVIAFVPVTPLLKLYLHKSFSRRSWQMTIEWIVTVALAITISLRLLNEYVYFEFGPGIAANVAALLVLAIIATAHTRSA